MKTISLRNNEPVCQVIARPISDELKAVNYTKTVAVVGLHETMDILKF